MRLEALATPELAAVHAAQLIGTALEAALEARGRATLALSGGKTPVRMLEHLARERLAWPRVDVLQVDERLVERDDPRRNSALLERFAAAVELPAERLHEMPVGSDALEPAREAYERMLVSLAGRPPVLDVVHLGLGEDGHTASLVPGDPALEARGAVAVTAPYRGTRRMTLTRSVLERARRQIWLATGAAKRESVRRLLAGDSALVAARVANEAAVLVSDRGAAGSAETRPGPGGSMPVAADAGSRR